MQVMLPFAILFDSLLGYFSRTGTSCSMGCRGSCHIDVVVREKTGHECEWFRVLNRCAGHATAGESQACRCSTVVSSLNIYTVVKRGHSVSATVCNCPTKMLEIVGFRAP